MNWIFNDWFEYNGEMYFYHALNLCPGKYNFSTNKISFAPELNKQEIYENGTLAKIHSVENKAFFLPVSGKSVIGINMSDYKTEVVDIDANQELWGNYAFSTIWNESLFIFPRHKSEVILLLDLLSSDISLKTIALPYKVHLGCQINEIVWLFSKSGDECIRFDMSNYTYSIIKLNSQIIGLISIDSDNDYVYLSLEGGIIKRFDVHSYKVEDVAIVSNSKTYYLSTNNQSIILLPDLSDDIFVIDKTNGEVNKYSEYPTDFRYVGPKDWYKYLGYKKINNNKWYALRSANHYMIVDDKNGNITWKRPIETSSKEDIMYFSKKEGIVHEFNEVKLAQLIESLTQ